MKATGIIRRIDDLGRVVVPKELRRMMRIKEGDPLEIFTTNENAIILKKYHENEPEKNGIAVEPSAETHKQVTIYDTENDKNFYLNLSESAYTLLYWLEEQGFFHYDVNIVEGHNIATENFLENGD